MPPRAPSTAPARNSGAVHGPYVARTVYLRPVGAPQSTVRLCIFFRVGICLTHLASRPRARTARTYGDAPRSFNVQRSITTITPERPGPIASPNPRGRVKRQLQTLAPGRRSGGADARRDVCITAAHRPCGTSPNAISEIAGAAPFTWTVDCCHGASLSRNAPLPYECRGLARSAGAGEGWKGKYKGQKDKKGRRIRRIRRNKKE